MRLVDLISLLPEGAVKSSSLADEACDINNVAFLTPDTACDLRRDTLYFTDGSVKLPSTPGTGQVSCIVTGGTKPPKSLAKLSDANIIRLSAGADPFACYNTVQAVFVEDQVYSSVIRRLLDAHFSNKGLQYLIDEASAALGKPIVVVDTIYRYIAYQLGDLPNEDTQLARVMEAEIANEMVLDSAIEYIRDERIDSEIARSRIPNQRYNDILGCNTLTSAVMVQGVCVAHVMMLEHGSPISEFDRSVFSRLTGFVAQEMQKSEIWGLTSGEMGSYFLANLIADRTPSEAATQRRMKALHFHPKKNFFLVCLHASGEGLSQLQAEHVAGQLRPVLHHALYTRYHQQLVLLLSRDYTDRLSQPAEQKLHEIALLNNLTVGVSNPYTSITETHTAFDQARAAIRLGERMSKAINDHRIYHYTDLCHIHLLELAGRRNDLLKLCHPALLKLVAHDEQRKSELVETLFCYLQTGCSTARSSKALSLHKNTLLYRIGKAQELMGLDLSSGEDRFILQMSFRILLMLGMFTPRVTLDREELRSSE